MADTEWIHHVSFDDLAPSLIDDEVQNIKNSGHYVGFKNQFIHVPPQFNPLYGLHHSTSAGGESSTCYNSLQDLGMSRGSFKARLPPPPGNSALKFTKPAADEVRDSKDYDLTSMGLSEERQIDRDTERNTEKNSGSRNGYTQAAFSHLSEPEDKVAAQFVGEKNTNRKSFVGMSDEELSKLEDYYISRSRATQKPSVDKFDFHEQRPIVYDSPPRKGVQGALVDPLAPIYPSRPVVTHKAISLTKQHVDYTTTRRTMSCYISGRRHSWAAADWYVENEVSDGDHFVVVTSISVFENQLENEAYQQRHANLSRSLSVTDSTFSNTSSSSYMSRSPLTVGLEIRDINEEAKSKCLKILDYYALRLGHKVVKITVEMVKGASAKNSLTKTAALYRPDFQIVSTVSTNIHIKFRNGNVKLPNFMMRHYAMPTYIVPYEFIDPKLLREDAEKPADRVKHLSPSDGAGDHSPTDAKNRLEALDKIILDTVKNPYAPPSTSQHDAGSETNVDDGSTKSYFPQAPEQKRKMELFESWGYVKPKLSRPDSFLKLGTNSELLDSNCKFTHASPVASRSSRLYSGGDTVYKVKSLVDDLGKQGDDSSPSGISSRDHHHQSHKHGGARLERSKTTPKPIRDASPSGHKENNVLKSRDKSAQKKHGIHTTKSQSADKQEKHGKHFGSFFKKLFG